jgi:hypothetical protein
MMKKSLIVAGTMLFAASAFAQSGTAPGASGKTPGHQMQKSTTSTAPGASEYAPGQKMKKTKSAKKSKAKGASEYAPGQQTTTGSAKATKATKAKK